RFYHRGGGALQRGGGGARLPPHPGGAAGSALPRARALLAQARRARAGGCVSSTVELPRVQGPGSGLGGAWRVIVLNDDHNTFDGVARALSNIIPGVTLDQGYAIADKI